MLPIDQIIPFVRHEDPLVADLALTCLKWVRWPQRLTGDFVLDAVRDGRPQLSRWLHEFPPSQAVLDYAIDALVSKSAGHDEFWIQRVIAEAPDQLLTPDRVDKVRRLKFQVSWLATRVHAKLAALELSTEQLRDRFVELCEEAERKMSAMSNQSDIRALADSLAYRGDVDWVMEKLGQFLGADNWAETWLFVILKKASHRPAFDLALGRFTDTDPEENDALVSELTFIIPELCVPADLERVTSLWERCIPESRSYLIEGIGQLRFPEAEPFLLRITEASEDMFVRTLGAMHLCEMLCPLEESRQLIARMIDDDDFDQSLVDLKELAVPLGTILGAPFPSQDQWCNDIERAHTRASDRQAKFGWMFEDRPGSGEGELHSQPAARREVSSYPQQPIEVTKLVSAKTVGRNDPCPCGSGRKYKKCCLKNE